VGLLQFLLFRVGQEAHSMMITGRRTWRRRGG
jgi:hypothetical protein